MTVFVSAAELAQRVHSGQRHTILAALWDAREGRAWAKFQSEHIPTAMFCDPAAELVSMPGREYGRNPMPPVDVLLRRAANWGLKPHGPVYIYDTGVGVFAARAWWTLRWLGVEDVYILDGGFRAWDAAGYESVAGPGNINVHEPLEFTPGSVPLAEIDTVSSFTGQLIDAREVSRFIGRREVLDLKAGHIPGAVNLPVYELFDTSTGLIAEVEVIRERLAQVGITQNTDPAEAIVYSGSGNHSALLLAAMAHAGLPVVSHYVSGWSQWSANPTNPVARNV